MPKEVSFNIHLLLCNDQTYCWAAIEAHDTDKGVRTFFEEYDSFNDALLGANRAVTAELARVNSRNSEKSPAQSSNPLVQLYMFD